MTLDECHAAGMTTRQAMAATGRTRSAVVAWAWRQEKTWAPPAKWRRVHATTVREIYLQRRSKLSQRVIGERYGVSRGTVSGIWRRTIWRKITADMG